MRAADRWGTTAQRLAFGSASLVMAVALVACGVPTDTPPLALPTGLVPHGSAAASPSTPAEPGSSRTVPVYFTSADGTLLPVVRRIGAGPTGVEVQSVLNQLVAGPTEHEQAIGLANSLPPGLGLTATASSRGTLVVDVTGDDPGPAAEQGRLATGQIVLSVTGLAGVTSVLLTRNGRPLAASLPDGSLTNKPLTAADYRPLTETP